MTNEIKRLQHMYATQYNPDPENRDYIWHPLNPISIYYRQAQEFAIADRLRSDKFDLTHLRVLDIGCGHGGLLRFLASLGTPPDQLFGIDLMDQRISKARRLAPAGMSLLVGNAETLPYPEQSFDLVVQFTVFSSILDAQLRQYIANEMIRVLKIGGHILWYDIYKTRNASLHCLSVPEIQQLFSSMVIRHIQPLHPIYAAKILRFSKFLLAFWEMLPGLPKTHYLLLMQKP